jgi:hypothetical protein
MLSRGETPPQAAEGVHFHGRSPVVWFFCRRCHKHRFLEMPSTHSAPSGAGGGKGTGFVGSPWATENPVTRFPPGQGGGASHQRGHPPEWYKRYMVVIFSHTFLFSLEGKVCSTFILLHSYVLSSITMISRLRRLFPPLVPYGTTFLLKGSMSLDFRVTTFPCKSSSFATPLCGGTTTRRASNDLISTTKHSAAKISSPGRQNEPFCTFHFSNKKTPFQEEREFFSAYMACII